jgi:hypothetical protein
MKKQQLDFAFTAQCPVKTQPKPSRATLQLIRAMKQAGKVMARTTAHHPAQKRLSEVCR